MSVIDKRLSGEAEGLKSDISNLEKKLHYLETTHKNSRENIEMILKSGMRG
jgi:prefoldin subunit 1